MRRTSKPRILEWKMKRRLKLSRYSCMWTRVRAPKCTGREGAPQLLALSFLPPKLRLEVHDINGITTSFILASIALTLPRLPAGRVSFEILTLRHDRILRCWPSTVASMAVPMPQAAESPFTPKFAPFFGMVCYRSIRPRLEKTDQDVATARQEWRLL